MFRGDSAKSGLNNPTISYSKCIKVLLGKGYNSSNPYFEHQISSIINYQEKLDGNTALHYSTMQADQEVIKQLLGRGANMGVKNWRDKAAVQAILPDTIREFLDEDCIAGDGVITDDDFKVTFKYDFLAPPKLSQEDGDDDSFEEGALGAEGEEKRALPETEALWYLSKASKDHRLLTILAFANQGKSTTVYCTYLLYRSLLKHPVIASFLWLKWQRIRTLFYVNMFLYCVFVILLTAFIFIKFGGRKVRIN